MKLRILAFTPRGAALARGLAEGFSREGWTCEARAFRPFPGPDGLPLLPPLEPPSLGEWTGAAFREADGLVFISACGIAVRAVAPFLRDKHTDPAVVAVDEGGSFAVSLLSGHAGGANRLVRRIARLCGAQAVITTATDVEGLFAVDDWAARNGWRLEEPGKGKALAAALLAGGTVTIRSDFPIRGELPRGLVQVEEGGDLWFTWSSRPGGRALKVLPPALTVGVGCRKGASANQVEAGVLAALAQGELSPLAVAGAATIHRKGREPGLLEFCQGMGWPLVTFSPEELQGVRGEFTASEFVQSVTGVDNVCERSAVLAGGRLLVPKLAGNGVTAAVAAREVVVDLSPEGGPAGEAPGTRGKKEHDHG